MLDINLFREEKGGNPEKIRESQRRRFANVDLVDEVIELDKVWRQRNYLITNIKYNPVSSLCLKPFFKIYSTKL